MQEFSVILLDMSWICLILKSVNWDIRKLFILVMLMRIWMLVGEFCFLGLFVTLLIGLESVSCVFEVRVSRFWVFSI